MGRKKGSKNKTKPETETRYGGYFIMDSGLEINFDISEQDGGDEFRELLDCQFVFGDNDTIWLGESNEIFIRAKKVVGFYIDSLNDSNGQKKK